MFVLYEMADNDLTFFQSIPWCASILDDSRRVIIPTNSRFPKESTEDAFFGDTLNTDRTVSACVSLYKTPVSPNAQIEEVTTLLSLGPGVNGYPHVCHGGMIATILDEVMGILLSVNKDREENSTRTTTGRSPSPSERMATVTAELLVKYLKPVATPQTVCVKVWVSKYEGRKLWVQGTIEDEKCTVLARGEGLFVKTGREKL